MSIRAINWAWEQMGLCPGAPSRLVLVALADRADDEGRTWPHVKTLAQKLAAHPDSIGRAIAQLEEAGLVERERKRRADGSYAGWEFRLPLESHPVKVPDGEPQPPGDIAGSHAEESSGQEPSTGTVTTTSCEPPSAQPLVAHFHDLAKAKGATVPRSLSARLGREAKRLLQEGFDPELVKHGIGLMVEKGLSPATLPSLVFEAQTASRVRQMVTPDRKLSPFARARQWVHGDGWRFDEADLAEMLGRDFGIEGEAKQRLMEEARSVRTSRAAA